MNAIEEVKESVSLLNQLLQSYNKESCSQSNQELIQVCRAQHIKKLPLCSFIGSWTCLRNVLCLHALIVLEKNGNTFVIWCILKFKLFFSTSLRISHFITCPLPNLYVLDFSTWLLYLHLIPPQQRWDIRTEDMRWRVFNHK